MNWAVTNAETLNTAVAGVLAKMTGGVALTMVIAALVTGLGLVSILFSGIFGWIIIFSPLAISLFLAWKSESLTPEAIKFWYIVFASVMGLSLSTLFYAFTTLSIVQALLCTVASFGALAAYGYFTKRDLSGLGPFLFAGVIGLIVMGIINIFLASSAFQIVLNILALVIFLGLTAYDMNRIRDLFWNGTSEEIERLQWFGALSLYINFINIFTSLLQLIGNREE